MSGTAAACFLCLLCGSNDNGPSYVEESGSSTVSLLQPLVGRAKPGVTPPGLYTAFSSVAFILTTIVLGQGASILAHTNAYVWPFLVLTALCLLTLALWQAFRPRGESSEKSDYTQTGLF